jgi:hypothetical protein
MGSNPAEDDGFLRAIKIQNITSFRGEVEPSVPCHNILWHVKGPDKYEKRYFVGKIHCNFLPSFSCFATRRVCW